MTQKEKIQKLEAKIEKLEKQIDKLKSEPKTVIHNHYHYHNEQAPLIPGPIYPIEPMGPYYGPLVQC